MSRKDAATPVRHKPDQSSANAATTDPARCLGSPVLGTPRHLGKLLLLVIYSCHLSVIKYLRDSRNRVPRIAQLPLPSLSTIRTHCAIHLLLPTYIPTLHPYNHARARHLERENRPCPLLVFSAPVAAPRGLPSSRH